MTAKRVDTVTNREALARLQADPSGFTTGEIRFLKYQVSLLGGFYTNLFAAMFYADDDNLVRLCLGFPEEVAALLSWRLDGSPNGLAARIRAAGFDL